MQEQEGDNRIAAKSKPMTMNLVSLVSTGSSTVQNPIASKSLGDTQSTLSNRLVKYRETWRESTQSRRSVEFSRMAKRCSSGRWYKETCRDRRRPVTLELSWRLSKYEENRRFKKLGNRRQWQSLAVQSPYFSKLRAARRECLLDRETKIWSQPDGSNEEVRCEHSVMVYIYVCHSSSCSSSWQKMTQKICESTKNQTKKNLRQLFQVTERLITDQTEITGLTTVCWQQPMWRERDDSADWQGCSVWNCQNLRLFLVSAVFGRYQYWTSQSLWKQDQMVLGNTLSQRLGSVRVETSSQDSPHREFSTRFKRWWLNQSVNKTRKQRKLYCECSQSFWVCSKIHARTMVVSRAWIREEMVRNPCQQTGWRMWENCWKNDAQLCRKRTSCISCQQRLRKRRIENRREKGKKSINQISVYWVVADLCR